MREEYQLNLQLEGKNSLIARDLKLNLQKLLEQSSLDQHERFLILLAVASTLKCEKLISLAKHQLTFLSFTPEQILEASESAAIMAMLNTYYRFKHMINKDEDYQSAALRMNILAKPALGKISFEMLALAISILNGCEMCIRSHELVLREANVSVEKIHDLVRLTAVVAGFAKLVNETTNS